MPKRTRLKSLAEVIEGRRALSSLLSRNRHHIALQRVIQCHLPALLREHCVGCVSREGRLVVFTDSPVWATQLRFALPALLPRVRSEVDSSLRQVQVRVVYHHQPLRAGRPALPPRPSVIEEVNAAAACCTSPELRSALQRLTATWSKLRR